MAGSLCGIAMNHTSQVRHNKSQPDFSCRSALIRKYYHNAVQIGNTLAMNNCSAHIVGHSLGGGLASAAQGGSGLTASTYNAAGLHPETVARYSEDAQHMAAEPGGQGVRGSGGQACNRAICQSPEVRGSGMAKVQGSSRGQACNRAIWR
jgi:hypothetical protein